MLRSSNNLAKLFARRISTSQLLSKDGYVSEGWWIKDHQPGPFPKTKQERAAAAAKYGLREEDYEPIPEEDCGNYPDLKDLNISYKDPYEDWSHDRFRRNFNEPVHRLFLVYMPERFTPNQMNDTIIQDLWGFLTSMGVIMLVCWVAIKTPVRIATNIMPKQFCFDYDRAGRWQDPEMFPLKHYTFYYEGDAYGTHVENGY